MARRLTAEQWERAVFWLGKAERIARRMLPFDTDLAHDYAVDAVMNAAYYCDQSDLSRMIAHILRGMVWIRQRKRESYNGIRARFERIDWVYEEDNAALQCGDDFQDFIDTCDLIDFALRGISENSGRVLKGIANGEGHKSACKACGVVYFTFRNSIVVNRALIQSRIARQLEIA